MKQIVKRYLPLSTKSRISRTVLPENYLCAAFLARTKREKSRAPRGSFDLFNFLEFNFDFIGILLTVFEVGDVIGIAQNGVL